LEALNVFHDLFPVSLQGHQDHAEYVLGNLVPLLSVEALGHAYVRFLRRLVLLQKLQANGAHVWKVNFLLGGKELLVLDCLNSFLNVLETSLGVSIFHATQTDAIVGIIALWQYPEREFVPCYRFWVELLLLVTVGKIYHRMIVSLVQTHSLPV
jgi:hypothetical protein